MSTEFREFHLFAGIGGGIYAGQLLGHKCVGAVELDDHCRDVLVRRQMDGWLERFRLFKDVKLFDGTSIKSDVDILCGGFPCQAFSNAAHGANISEKDLWNEMFRIIGEARPPVVFAENVAERAIEKARQDLQGIGYRVECCILSNANLGADHQRPRFWLLAYSNDESELCRSLYDATQVLPKFCGGVWATDPSQCGVATGASHRSKQLKATGNAQSPVVAATAFRVLVNRLGRP